MGTLLSATGLMFRTHLVGVLRSKRALVCLLLTAAPVGLAFFPSATEDAFNTVAVLGMMFTLQVVAPLVGLLAGSVVVTEEIENRTITYVFTRPVHRSSLFLGRWLATLVVTSSMLGLSAWGVTQVARAERAGDEHGRVVVRVVKTVDDEGKVANRTEYKSGRLHAEKMEDEEGYERRTESLPNGSVRTIEEVRRPIDRHLPAGMTGRYVWAAVLAGALYSLLTAGLGVFIRRPMIVGLGYAFAVEGLLANVPGSSQKLSIQYYLRAILTGLRDARAEAGDRAVEFWRGFDPIANTAFPGPGESSLRLLILMVLVAGLCTWAIGRRQYVLTS